MTRSNLHILFPIFFALTLPACSTLFAPNKAQQAQPVNVGDSYLNGDNTAKQSSSKVANSSQEETDQQSAFTRLNPNSSKKSAQLNLDIANYFNNKNTYQVSANALPLNEFLHYTLGELLNVSYLIEPSIKAKTTPVTLELKEKVSAKRLFQLVQQVLEQNSARVQLNDNVFYIYPQPKQGSNSDSAFGFGRKPSDVPNVADNIVQLVPVKYQSVEGLQRMVGDLVDAKVTANRAQGFLSIQGAKEQIIRALSLIELLDSPLLYNKSTAIISFRYIDTETFILKVTELLAQEGISTNLNAKRDAPSASFIPLEHLGKVVVFASAEEILNRIEYWAKLLDKPASGSEQSFYIYHPKYARASDLGASLAPLLGANGFGGTANSQKLNTQNQGINNQNTQQNSQSQVGLSRTDGGKKAFTVQGEDIRLVVDERANALIFYSSGKHYQELQPIIKKLDIMPKQIMMEVVIAEVKLTGSFAKGVQFALKNGASGKKNETFNFKSKGGFSYSIVGLPGSLNVNLNQTDGLVNVLSRPTLLVRDGVSANISVGDDIPTIGSTTSDPINGERQTTNIEYRKTGVRLQVTPTINAQGTVIMSIAQSISNVSPTSKGAGGTPAIFERSINTEVVAGNGETVMLGGLISQSKDNNATSVPVMGNLPVVGHLFRSDTENVDKTELVVLVTPKIVSNKDDWQRVKESFIKGLEYLKF